MLPSMEKDRMKAYISAAIKMCNGSCENCKDSRSSVVYGCDIGYIIAERVEDYATLSGKQHIFKHTNRLKKSSEVSRSPELIISELSMLDSVL